MLMVGGVKTDGNIFLHQSDAKAWDDDDVGSTSHTTFSHQDISSLDGTI
jgi:hypothetical protein